MFVFRFEYKPKNPVYKDKASIAKEVEMWAFGAVLLVLLLWLQPDLSFATTGSLATLLLAIKAQRELRILRKGVSEIQLDDEQLKFSYMSINKDPLQLLKTDVVLEVYRDKILFKRAKSAEVVAKAFRFKMVAGDWDQLLASFPSTQINKRR